MLDIKIIRAETENVVKKLNSRGQDYSAQIAAILEKDARYRKTLACAEELRAKRNELAKSFGKDKPSAEDAKAAGEIKKCLADLQKEETALKQEIDNALLFLPNLVWDGIPAGASEKDNKFIRENNCGKREFSFQPKDHHEIGQKLGILDFETAVKLSGARFALLRNKGARLERALINFMLDKHTKENGYVEFMTPYIVSAETMTGTGQLPKFENDLFKLAGEKPQYLIPTAEVPLTNMFRGETVKEENLPMKFTAFTACFRQEAGSYGKDTRGLIRNHQFNKVELVWLAKPEESMNALEKLVKDAESVLSDLEIPHRVIELCSADIGFSSSRTYDIEVWMPSENKYREISSCSNCTDFQARRMNLRLRRNGGGLEFVHTLNGSGIAVGRTFAAILENYQQEDGSVIIPKKLVPYFGEECIK